MGAAIRRVVLSTPEEHKAAGSGGRVGTLWMSARSFARRFGDPHAIHEDGTDEPVAEWSFTTPRGAASVHTYWWNGAEELSIGDRSLLPPHQRKGHKPKAARWLIRALQERGLPAHVGRPDA